VRQAGRSRVKLTRPLAGGSDVGRNAAGEGRQDRYATLSARFPRDSPREPAAQGESKYMALLCRAAQGESKYVRQAGRSRVKLTRPLAGGSDVGRNAAGEGLLIENRHIPGTCQAHTMHV
jgi:hypothetical protein